MQETILVVEDEVDLGDLLRYHLKKAGYAVRVARDGLEGLAMARSQIPDAVILDLMLPGTDGQTVCKALRSDEATQAIPVIMVTAKSEAADRERGLELGADDYVTKPFSFKELVLRVKAVLRRAHPSARADVLDVGDFQIDRKTFEIRLENRRLDLTSIEFKVLAFLLERRGRTQSRETLLADVWGYQNAIDTRTVDTHMRRLREKLGRHAVQLETVRGEGYRFNGKVGS